MDTDALVGQLLEIEEIKKLKARYFRFMDSKRWTDWGQVFTEDAVLEPHSARPNPYLGRDAIVSGVSTGLADMVTVHHGHMPEITLTSADTAAGVWAMEDYLIATGGPNVGRVYRGYGHYFERYVKLEDGWHIKSLRLTRLHTEATSYTSYADGMDSSRVVSFDV